jgi:hypothetical protein
MAKYKKVKVVVAGSRGFSDYELLKDQLTDILSGIVLNEDSDIEFEIVSGGARGADKLGERFAKEGDLKLVEIHADWKGVGKQAGMLRNIEMAKYASESDKGVLVAFWDGVSRGTEQMIRMAEKYYLDIYIINYVEQ